MVGFAVTLASCNKRRAQRSEQCQHPHAWPQHHLVPPSTAPAHTAPPAQPSGPPPSPSAVAAQHSQCSAGKQGLGWRWAAPRRPQQSQREPHAGRWGGRRAGAAGGPRGAAPWGGWGSAAAAGRERAGLAPSCHGTASTQQLQQCHSQGVTTHPILPTFQLHPILCLIFLHHNTAVSCPSCISSRIPSLPHPILCLILLALHPKCPIPPSWLPTAASPPPHSHLWGKAAHALCVQLQGEAPRELEGNRGWGAGGTTARTPWGSSSAPIHTISAVMFLRRAPAVKYTKAAVLATNSVTATSSMGSCSSGSPTGCAEKGLCHCPCTPKNSPCVDRQMDDVWFDGCKAQPVSLYNGSTLRPTSPCCFLIAGCPSKERSMAAKGSS